jgi:hypothetical protein
MSLQFNARWENGKAIPSTPEDQAILDSMPEGTNLMVNLAENRTGILTNLNEQYNQYLKLYNERLQALGFSEQDASDWIKENAYRLMVDGNYDAVDRKIGRIEHNIPS